MRRPVSSRNGQPRVRRERSQPAGGARVWYFADGFLPAKQPGDKVEAHEALMILNPGPKPAKIRFDFYFEDREPVLDVRIELGARRVKCYRLDWPKDIGGVELPVETQYAIRVRSHVPIIIQQGRIDTRQPNLSYYSPAGLSER